MKKLFILMGAICLIAFISCNESNEKSESFTNILKDSAQLKKFLNDSTNRQLFLHVADSVSWSNPTLKDDDGDDIDENITNSIRTIGKVNLPSDKWPVITMPVKRMQAFIKNQTTTAVADTIIFYLGTYKVPQDVKRYNTRNSSSYQYKDLEGKPTFILRSLSNYTNAKLVTNKIFKDGAGLCPPPPGGCY